VGFFDKIQDTINTATEQTKAKAQDVQLKREKTQKLSVLGEQAYNLYLNGQLANQELAAACAEIADLDRRIAEAETAVSAARPQPEAPQAPGGYAPPPPGAGAAPPAPPAPPGAMAPPSAPPARATRTARCDGAAIGTASACGSTSTTTTSGSVSARPARGSAATAPAGDGAGIAGRA